MMPTVTVGFTEREREAFRIGYLLCQRDIRIGMDVDYEEKIINAILLLHGLDPKMSDTEALALFMIHNGFTTGHGDTVSDLLGELGPQIERLLLERGL